MGKYYIDANALAPLAAAFSGESRMAGANAALRNQMLSAQIGEQQLRNDEMMRQQEARGRLDSALLKERFGLDQRTASHYAAELTGEQPVLGFKYGADGMPMMGADGVPLPDEPTTIPDDLRKHPQWADAVRAIQGLELVNAYGGDAKTAAATREALGENDYNQTLRDGIVGHLRSNNPNLTMVSTLNQLRREGANLDNYTTNSSGAVLNKASGALDVTNPLALSEIGKNDSAAQYNIAGVGLRAHQANTEQAKQQSLINEIRLNEEKLNLERAKYGDSASKVNLLDAAIAKQYFGDGYNGVDANQLAEFNMWATNNYFTDQNQALGPYLAYKNGKSGNGLVGGRFTGAIGRAGSGLAGGNAIGSSDQLSYSTPYDVKTGTFGDKGSISYADNIVYYDKIATENGMAPLSSNPDKMQVAQNIYQLYQSGAIKDREHVAALHKALVSQK